MTSANGNGMSVNGRRRVVITGMGAVTPLGNDVATSWQNLCSGMSGAAPITQFDPDGYFATFACELKDFEPTNWIEYKTARRMDRFAQMVVAAARVLPTPLLARLAGGGRARRTLGRRDG